MTEKMPTEVLEEEHRTIQKVVVAMAVLAQTLEDGGQVDPAVLQDIVAFMRTFADQCHHGKEEAHLFPALEKRGVPAHGCPLAALRHEHEKGRASVAALAEAVRAYGGGDPQAREALLGSLGALVALYPDHIWKEDYLLFPMANKVLTPEDQADVRQKFEAVEDAVGRDVHHRFEQLANRLQDLTSDTEKR